MSSAFGNQSRYASLHDTRTILCSILVGSLKNTGNVILVKSVITCIVGQRTEDQQQSRWRTFSDRVFQNRPQAGRGSVIRIEIQPLSDL
jgi:hypothetical protein